MTVPFYSYEQEFQGYIPERYALKSERNGLAKLVRHKKGSINRVLLHRRPGDPKPTTPRDYMGKAYSWEQPLDDGHQPWTLRPLAGRVSRGDRSHEYHLAPCSLRPIVIRVLLDCLVEAAYTPTHYVGTVGSPDARSARTPRRTSGRLGECKRTGASSRLARARQTIATKFAIFQFVSRILHFSFKLVP